MDIHTPLWLWSRYGFKMKVGECDAKSSRPGEKLLLSYIRGKGLDLEVVRDIGTW